MESASRPLEVADAADGQNKVKMKWQPRGRLAAKQSEGTRDGP